MGRSSRRRLAAIGALAAMLGTATVLAVTGTREPASAIRLLSGDAWLSNTRAGSTSHVDGYSGKADGQVGVSHAGDPFTIVQRPDGAYILDLKTGRLTRVGSASLAADASRQLPGQPSALQVLTAGSTTWVLDHSSGILQQVNPTSLAAVGAQIPLGAPTGTATVDAAGNVWVPLPSKGVVDEVATSGAVSPHPVGQPGDAVQVATASSGVWAIDPQAGQATSLTNTGVAPVALPQTPSGTMPLVGASATADHIAILEGDQLLDLDTAQPSLGSTSSPDYYGATQIALVGDTAYLLDPASHQLDVVNLNPLAPAPPIDVPPGSNQLIPKDNLLFVNNPASPQAVVVNTSGQVTPITKYLPTPASPSPGQAPNPLQSPINGPSLPTPGGGGSGPPSSGQGPPTPTGPTLQPTGPPASAPNNPPAPTTTNPRAPGAPTVTAVSATAGDLTVSWSPPASAGTSPVTSYQVTAAPQGTGNQGHATASGSTTSTKVTGLSGGLRYCAQVQAVNAAGAGPLSINDGSPTVCATTTADTPGQVTTVNAAGGAGVVNVAWSAPALGPYQTPIAGYHVVVAPHGGGTPAAKDVAATSVAFSGLAAGATYDVTVQAVNQTQNKGPASSPRTATTDGPPSGLALTQITPSNAGELTATWSPAQANNGQTVAYSASISGGSTAKVSGNQAVFGGLGAGTYTITITATASGGAATHTSGQSAPWVLTAYLNTCRSTDKNWEFVTVPAANCDNVPGGGYTATTGRADFNWPTSQPPGTTPLVTDYGTPTPGDPSSGTYYAFTQGSNPNPPVSHWYLTNPNGPYAAITWVWTSASSAPSGATELCEAQVPDTTANGNRSSFFDLYKNGEQPGGSSCVAHFWV